VTFEEAEGKMVYWHSSAHILGECMERDFGVHLCHGPPTDSGFFYDAYTGHDVTIRLKSLISIIGIWRRPLQGD
jgi:threonyl-tRNA synthetase